MLDCLDHMTDDTLSHYEDCSIAPVVLLSEARPSKHDELAIGVMCDGDTNVSMDKVKRSRSDVT